MKEQDCFIFRLDAVDLDPQSKSKAVAGADKYSGLKSTVHITIGSRVMLTNNIWVRAGLINGAQGVVVDVVFQSQDELPEYVLINFDDYKGPRIYPDEDKKTWVPIFKMTKQHHLNQAFTRTQIPIRLSSAMTGHKVQGLSLYNGIVIEYPAVVTRQVKDPMSTWGLNYCMLTRAPDLTKVAFINLPDYKRHMKLYDNTKGVNYKRFQRFSDKAQEYFKSTVMKFTGITLQDLKSSDINLFTDV